MNTWTRVTMASVVKPSLTVYYVEADDDTVTEGFHHAHEVGDGERSSDNCEECTRTWILHHPCIRSD